MSTLPQAFIESIKVLGPATAGLADALLTDPEVSIRLNRAKGAELLQPLEQVPWCSDGFYLPGREAFTFDPAMHQGLYYVQDASSMALAAVASMLVKENEGRPLRWLDACAAPGGKTTAIASRLPEGSALLANEFDTRRAAILAENVAKWGLPFVACTKGDAARFARMKGTFDVISADVPCSGEGMMRKDAEAATQWSPSLVAECARMQWRIVEALWQALRPGGALVYSTCTFNRHENEEIVERLVREYGASGVTVPELELPEILHGIDTDVTCYRFLPGRVRGEGLFLCVLRKPGEAPAAVSGKTKTGKSDVAVQTAASWLEGDFCLNQDKDGTIFALPREMATLAPELRGVAIAGVKGRDIVPMQGLALSTALRKGCFPNADVDYGTALAYLRREAVVLPDAPRGIVLLHYGGAPLGFAKNLGNRANNLYPQAWRIMSSHAPELPPQLVHQG
ncbi:MAG: hypothetical protein K2M12_10620 [Muribaculaceae bacterium]|nr:hypothetical protein [Muribaculaceae bacterium]